MSLAEKGESQHLARKKQQWQKAVHSDCTAFPIGIALSISFQPATGGA